MRSREQNVSVGRRFTVYGLVDPRDGLIHYVGRTCLPLRYRLSAHVSFARRNWSSGVGIAKHRWVHGLIQSGLAPSIRALESFDSLEASNDGETKWLALGKAEGWPLTNKHLKGGGGNKPADEKRRVRAELARLMAEDASLPPASGAVSSEGVRHA